MIAPLEQQTLGNRIATTFIIVVVVILIIAFIGWLSGGWEAEGQAYTSRPEWDARMIELDRAALDQAYTQHLILVWTNWLKDGGAPTRHVVGFKKARDGYVASMSEIEKRERQ